MIRHDDLLSNLDWARELAAKLAGNRHDGDDAVQDASITALERTPPALRSFRAWFREVLIRHVLMARRRERRRAARERAVAGDGVVAGGNGGRYAVVDLQAVTRRVTRLAEPYRTAILLRYYQGLSASEIATRLEVPVETVRTRLKRAHRTLRRELGVAAGEDRRRASLLTLIGRVFGSKGAKAAATAALVVAVTTVALVVVESDTASTPDPPEPKATDVASSPTTAAGSATPGADRSDRGAVTRLPAAVPRDTPDPVSPPAATVEPSGRHVHGRVTDDGGNPIPGARVSLFAPLRWWAMPTRTDYQAVERVASTDADGRYTLPALAGFRSVDAMADGYATVVQYAKLRHGVEKRLDFVLPRPGTLHGRVTFGRTQPCARAALMLFNTRPMRFPTFGPNGAGRVRPVRLAYAHTLTDRDGEYELGCLAPGIYDCTIHAPRNPRIRLEEGRVEIVAGQAAVRMFHLPPRRGIRLEGAVRDRDTGEPLPGARVVVTDNPRHRARCDVEGRYRLEGLEGLRVVVRVTADGHHPVQAEIDLTSGNDVVRDLRLWRFATVRGRVVDAEDRPIAGAHVVTDPFDFGDPTAPGAVFTDADGAFRLDRLDPMITRLFSRAAEHCPGRSSPLVLVAGGELDRVRIQLARGGHIQGRLWPSATPDRRGRAVSLQSLAGTGDFRADAVGLARVQPDGRFQFRHVPPGTYRFTSWLGRQHHTFVETASVSEGGVHSVELKVIATACLAGRVENGAGRPLADLELQASSGTGPADLAVTDGDGRFRFEGMTEDRYSVTTAGRGEFKRTVLEAVEPGRTDLVLRLERRATASGQVVDAATGDPVESFWLRIFPHEAADEWVLARRHWFDREGRFTLAPRWGRMPLPDGRFDLEAGTESGLVSRVLKNVKPGAGSLRIELLPGGALRGVVMKSRGPAPFARLRVAGADRKHLRLAADSDGRFTLRSLQGGLYRIEAFHHGQVAEARVTVTWGETRTVKLVVHPGAAAMVTVVNPDGEPLRRARVRLQPLGRGADHPAARTGWTGADGTVAFPGLLPGSYDVAGEGAGFAPCTRRFILGARQAVQLRLRLRRGVR